MDLKIKPRTLSGFMELSPGEQIIFNRMVKTLENVYRLYGFQPLDTPILEASEILLAKAGGETEKQIYRFTKGGTDLTMRFDLTVPLAKYAAMYYGSLAFPFRRYQIGKVYRGERAQKGRFREFYQADIDIVGDGALSCINDAEIISVIYTAFKKLGLMDFTVRINNRKLLYGLFIALGMEAYADDIMRIIDKIGKIGKNKVKAELEKAEIKGIDEILHFISINGNNEEILSSVAACPWDNEIFKEGISELREVVCAAMMFGIPEESFKIDLSIARGLDYYTGTVYETVLNKYPAIGSICSGGRYDNLCGFYSDKKLPGVGVSIGLTRLFDTLGKSAESIPPVDVMIIPMTDDIGRAISFASLLRDSGINSQIYFEDKKLKSKLNYAGKLNAGFVVFLGEDEIIQNTVTLKNFISGEQITVNEGRALEIIKEAAAMSASMPVFDID